LNLQEDDGYTFNFKQRKWVLEEWCGDHQEFEYKNQKEGIIESLPSQLKEVYNRYLSALEKGNCISSKASRSPKKEEIVLQL
jgi:hypothetical protein